MASIVNRKDPEFVVAGTEATAEDHSVIRSAGLDFPIQHRNAVRYRISPGKRMAGPKARRIVGPSRTALLLRMA